MDIKASLGQVLDASDPPFSGRFYQTLFKEHPEVERHFAGLDMQEQGAMLTMALSVIVQHDRECNRATENYLKVLGHRHRRLGISRRDYQRFVQAMITTLGAFHGADWTEPLADAWSSAIENSIDTMLRGHTDEQIIY